MGLSTMRQHPQFSDIQISRDSEEFAIFNKKVLIALNTFQEKQ